MSLYALDLGANQVDSELKGSKSFWEERLGILVRQTDMFLAAPEDDLQRRPRDLTADSIRTWILENCRKLDVSPSRVALLAGLAASTLNRFLRGGKNNLNADTITVIAQAFARTAAELGERDVPPPIVKHWAKMANLASVPIVGRLEALDTTIFPGPFEYAVVPVASFKRASVVALEVDPQGGLVFVRPFYDRPEIADGSRVLGHIRSGEAIESVTGTYRISPGGPNAAWLVHENDRSRDRFLGGLDPEDLLISSAVVGRLTIDMPI